MAAVPDALWLWNGDLEPERLARQLGAARAAGYRSLVAWPWAGMAAPFAGERHLEAVRRAAEAASRQGMTLWLADDVHWPSGTAGGQLLTENPDAAQRALVVSTCWASNVSPQVVRWRGEGERLVLALALDDAGARRDLSLQLEERGKAVRERRSSSCDGYRTRWESEVWESELRLPPGEWFVTIATVVRLQALLRSAVGCVWSPAATGALDVLDEAAVDSYVARAIQPLAEAAGQHAGRSVAGVVSVAGPLLQPHTVAKADGWRTDVLPWVRDLPQVFERLFARQLATHLPYALAPLHEGQPSPPVERLLEYAEERRTELFVTRVGEWCAARGLGRLVLEEAALRRLPVVPESVRGERKRGIDPERAALVAPVAQGEGDAVPVAAIPSLAALRAPRTHTHEQAWESLDVFAEEWEWEAGSMNVLPLGDWREWEHVGRARDGTVRYDVHVAFEADYVPEDPALLVEAGILEAVTINGTVVPLDGGRAPETVEIEGADESYRLVRFHPNLLRTGVNMVSATAAIGPVDRVLFEPGAGGGPLFVAGALAVAEATTGGPKKAPRWRLVRPPVSVGLGDWGAAGYPRYSGTGRYAQTVRLPVLPERTTVHLQAEAFGGAVTLRVDGRLAERAGATPYTFDLTGRLSAGMVRVELDCRSGLGARLGGGVPAGLAAVKLEIRS